MKPATDWWQLFVAKTKQKNNIYKHEPNLNPKPKELCFVLLCFFK